MTWTVRSLVAATAAAGLILLGAAGWQVWGMPARTAAAQTVLESAWPTPPVFGPPAPHLRKRPAPVPVEGVAVARLRLPRLGLSWVVVQGVSTADLNRGPGHYPGSAMPGQVGNFAVAGHRMAGVFADLDQLRPGDPIVVEDRSGRVWTYRVTAVLVVDPTAVDQVAPTPGHADQPAVGAVATLTTCWPRWGNSRRLVVHAGLVGAAAPV